MMLALQLRHLPEFAAEASAWFLPGASATHWLEELAQCGLANGETRLFVVPRSIADRSPAGLLVVPGKGASPSQPPAGLACRFMAERLFLPADAALSPPLTEAEVRSLCLLPISFLHPALGLSAFESETTLRVWDLLASPAESSANWNYAQAGAPKLPQLEAIVLAQPPSLEDLFGGAEADIGVEPPFDLPPAPDEPAEDAAAKSARALRRWLAKGVAGVTRHVPHSGTRRTWINDAEDWAHRQLQQVGGDLQKLRNKELHRLLHLFDTDPESALRHAIPMNAFAHRGVASPGGKLGSRWPNFDLSRLGGRAADFWNVPPDLQEILRRRYREMADREMQLGRHRRAAYIYAELLGDLVSAANALKQGRHFREAALIYDEHLKNPLEAARCLAEGGLFSEAIERYEKLGRWLDIADLHERSGNIAAAHAAIRKVVAERVAQDDLLGAAKLVDERLREPDEALEMLLRAWPSSRQAAACVGAAFQLLARLGRHEVALDLVGRFRRETIQLMVLPLLQALSGPARDYPDERVRHRATDFSRVLIGRQLSERKMAPDEASRLLEYLVRLAPEDRLLARDANRHRSARREAELRVRRLTPPPMPGGRPILLRRFELPRQMEWVRLRSEWHWFFAVGLTPKRLTLVRGIWEGEIQSVSWDCPAETARQGLVLEPNRDHGHRIALKTLQGPDFAEKRFPATDLFFGTECLVGTPEWLRPQHWPVAFGEDCLWTAHVAGGRGVVSCHDRTGKLLRTLDLTETLLAGAERTLETRLCLAAVGSVASVALGNRLVIIRSEGLPLPFELPGQAVDLLPTLPHTRAGVAVMLEHGASMHWLGTPGLLELERDLARPRGAFVPGGPLVLAADTQLVCLEVDSRGVQRVTRVEWNSQRPVGVSATSSPGQFAILGASGEVSVYRLSD